jgi:fumarate reductase subunit C
MAEQITRRPYIREVPRTRWFLEHPRYVRYMAREVTCFFVGGYAVLLLIGIWRLSQGPAAYEAFLHALQNPASIALHVLALVFSVYHSITWFNLTPQALPVQIGERILPGGVIAAAHYVAWAVVSATVLVAAGVF